MEFLSFSLRRCSATLLVFSLHCFTIGDVASQRAVPTAAPGAGGFLDIRRDGSYRYAYATGDVGRHYHTAAASPENTVSGRYGERSPKTGAIQETVYTSGRNGFRARGPHIARKMSLSQNKIPYNPPVSPNSPRYNPTYSTYNDPNNDPTYEFGFRTPTHSRQEASDSKGKVDGSYTYVDDVGVRHTVSYEAGAKTGFHVKTPFPDSDSIGGALFYRKPNKGGKGFRGHSAIQQNTDGSFRFTATGPDQKHTETADKNGNRRGTYTYLDPKGVQRTTEYIAGPGIGYKVINTKLNAQFASAYPFLPPSFLVPGEADVPENLNFAASSSFKPSRPNKGGSGNSGSSFEDKPDNGNDDGDSGNTGFETTTDSFFPVKNNNDGSEDDNANSGNDDDVFGQNNNKKPSSNDEDDDGNYRPEENTKPGGDDDVFGEDNFGTGSNKRPSTDNSGTSSDEKPGSGQLSGSSDEDVFGKPEPPKRPTGGRPVPSRPTKRPVSRPTTSARPSKPNRQPVPIRPPFSNTFPSSGDDDDDNIFGPNTNPDKPSRVTTRRPDFSDDVFGPSKPIGAIPPIDFSRPISNEDLDFNRPPKRPSPSRPSFGGSRPSNRPSGFGPDNQQYGSGGGNNDYGNCCNNNRGNVKYNDRNPFRDSQSAYSHTRDLAYDQHSSQNVLRDRFFSFPPGVAVRAHVQSLDIVPYGSRMPPPGLAIDQFLPAYRRERDALSERKTKAEPDAKSELKNETKTLTKAT